MIKILDKSTLKPVNPISQNSIKTSCYPDISIRSNIIPVHKNSDKQLVKNSLSDQSLSYAFLVRYLKNNNL